MFNQSGNRDITIICYVIVVLTGFNQINLNHSRSFYHKIGCCIIYNIQYKPINELHIWYTIVHRSRKVKPYALSNGSCHSPVQQSAIWKSTRNTHYNLTIFNCFNFQLTLLIELFAIHHCHCNQFCIVIDSNSNSKTHTWQCNTCVLHNIPRV